MASIQIDIKDGLSSSVAIKGPCRVATTANITLSGKQTIDGVAVVTDDRVLVKNQTIGSENGIYIADTGAWRRSKDFNKTKDIKTGTMVNVVSGSTNAGWWEVTTTGDITVGTTSIAFALAISLSTGVGGTLPIAHGGTGQTTASAAFDALSPNTTRGDITFRNATTNARLAASTAGYLLQTNGGGADPSWAGFLPAGAGAVTRTWQDKARDVVSLTDFSGTGDVALAAALVAAKEVYIPAGTFNITNNVTVGDDRRLIFASGAILNISAGITFNCTGSLEAGRNQIFTGSGSVTGLRRVCPEWFGAVRDYTTDSTSAFTKSCAALFSGVASGGLLDLDSANYVVSGATTFVLPAFSSVVGKGKFSSGFRFSTAACNLFDISAGNITIQGFNTNPVSGSQATSGAVVTAVGTSSVNSSNLCVRDISFSKAYTCINLVWCSAVKINSFDFNDYAMTGVQVQNSGDIFLNNFVMFVGGGGGGTLGGIRLIDRVEALVAECGDIIGGTYSMTTTAASNMIGVRPAYLRFTDIYFDSASNGVGLSTCVSTKFIGCWFSNRPNDSITISNCSEILFQACEFVNGGANGANVGATSTYIKFHGCEFINNSSGGVNTYHGLSIAPNTTDFEVIGCTFNNALGFSGQQGYGIIVNAGTSDRYIIANNLVTGNGLGGISDGGTGTNKKIYANIGYTTENLMNVSATTNAGGDVTFNHGLAATPTKWLATVLCGAGTAPVIASFVSATSTTITFRIFLGTSALASTSIVMSAQVAI